MPAMLAPGASLLHDTGAIATDGITSDGRLVVTAPPGAATRYSVAPGVWTTTAPVQHEGLNTVSIRRIDPIFGWSASRKISFNLDTVAPRAPIRAATNDAAKDGPEHLLDRDSTLVINYDAKTPVFIIAVDGRAVRIPVTAKGRISISVASLASGAGPHVVTATTCDVAGNASSAEFHFQFPAVKAAATPAFAVVPAPVRPDVPKPLLP